MKKIIFVLSVGIMSLTCALEDAAVSTKQTLTNAIAVAEKRETLPARFLRRWARNSALFYAVLASDRLEFPVWSRIFNHQIARIGVTKILSEFFPDDFVEVVNPNEKHLFTQEQIDCKTLSDGFVTGLSVSLFFVDRKIPVTMTKTISAALGLGLANSIVECVFDKKGKKSNI